MQLNEELVKKWQPILEHGDLPEIKDPLRRSVTEAVLENTETALREQNNFAPKAYLRQPRLMPWVLLLVQQVMEPLTYMIQY